MQAKRKVKAVSRSEQPEVKEPEAPPVRKRKIMTDDMKALSERKKAEKEAQAMQKEAQDKEVEKEETTSSNNKQVLNPPKPRQSFDDTHTRKSIYLENHHLARLHELKTPDRSVTRIVNEALAAYLFESRYMSQRP